MPSKSLRMFAASLMLLSMQSCEGMIQVGSKTGPVVQVGSNQPPPPTITNIVAPSACAWEKDFVPDAGFEKRWTRGEKEQAVEHNRLVKKECAAKPAAAPASNFPTFGSTAIGASPIGK